MLYPQQVGDTAYLASLTLPRTSFNANSAALPFSHSSDIFCLCSRSVFCCICLETSLRISGTADPTGRGGRLLMTPVACQCISLKTVRILPSPRGVGFIVGEWTRTGDSSPVREGLEVDTGVDSSFLTEDVRACLRVMPPRILRISSTLWTPSGGLGFLAFMYKSRWRPREEEVKAWWQKGQFLSFGADSFGALDSEVDRGVAIEEPAMVDGVRGSSWESETSDEGGRFQ